MGKQFIILLVTAVFFVDAAGIDSLLLSSRKKYALRPVSAKLSAQDLMEYTTLETFRPSHLFINTDDIDFGGEDGITLEEMVKRYVQIPGAQIGNPDDILMLIRERDGEIITRDDFFWDYEGNLAKQGEYYWAVYILPRPVPGDDSYKENDYFVSKHPLSREEQSRLDSEFKELGHRGIYNHENWDYLAQQWINENISRGNSALVLSKKLMRYFYVAFPDDSGWYRYLDKCQDNNKQFESVRHIMRLLLRHVEVEQWAQEAAMLMYEKGYHKRSDDDTRDNFFNSYVIDFEFLISLLVDNETEAVLPIAADVYADMHLERRDTVYSEDKAGMLNTSMVRSDKEFIKRAVFFKAISCARFPSRFNNIAKRINHASNYDEDFLKEIYDIIKYLCCVLTNDALKEFYLDSEVVGEKEIRSVALGQSLVFLLGDDEISAVFDMLSRESNMKIVENFLRLFCTLYDTLGPASTLRKSKKIMHRFIDFMLYIIPKRKWLLTEYADAIANMSGFDVNYRKQEMEALLLELLDDEGRDDIPDVLSILTLHRSKPAQEKVINRYLNPDSRYLKNGLIYLRDIADPAYFDKAWKAILEIVRLRNGDIDIEDITLIGEYAIAVLEHDMAEPGSLDAGQKSRIEAFFREYILNNKNATSKQSKNTVAIMLDHIRSSLIILLDIREAMGDLETRIDQIWKACWDGLKPEIMRSLSFASSEQAYNVLFETSEKLLLGKKESQSYLSHVFADSRKDLNVEIKKRLAKELAKLLRASFAESDIGDEKRELFKDFFNMIMFWNPDVALEILNMADWEDVDLTHLDIVSWGGDGLPKELRSFFLRRYFRYLAHCYEDESRVETIGFFDNPEDFTIRLYKKINCALRVDLGLKINIYEELKKEDQRFKTGLDAKEVVAMSLILFLRAVKSFSGTGLNPEDINFKGIANAKKWLKENNILTKGDNRFILEKLRLFLYKDAANKEVLYSIIWDNIVSYFWPINEEDERAYFNELYNGFAVLLDETLELLVRKDLEKITPREFFNNEKVLADTVKSLGGEISDFVSVPTQATEATLVRTRIFSRIDSAA